MATGPAAYTNRLSAWCRMIKAVRVGAMTKTDSHSAYPPVRHFSRRQKIIGAIVILVALALLAFAVTRLLSGSKGLGFGGNRRGGMTTTVGTAKATLTDMPVEIEALGTATPTATVTVRPQVSGVITKVLFREGQMVRKGQTLAVIDPRPFQMALMQAQGTLSRDQAELQNARLTLTRYQTLLKQDSIARQEVDTQAALVRQLEGTVMTDKAAVGTAKLNLEFSNVVAPVDGRVGLRVVDIGNYISAGDANGLVVLTTVSPIDVEFSIPQDQAPTIEERVRQGAKLTAVALDRSRSKTLDRGLFSTLDNQVDTETGTVRAKARFPNRGNTLYPNQFVNVRLEVNVLKNVVTVPSTALRQGSASPYVWVLARDKTVAKRDVAAGETANDQVTITSGLKAGETVITEGGDRLTPGAHVRLPGDQDKAGGTAGQGKRQMSRNAG